MQANPFQSLNQSAEQLKFGRAVKSDGYYKEGMALLEQAQDGTFASSEFLPQACRLFLQAVQSNRSDLRPLLALAYIYLILEDFNTALEYLQLVFESDPQHEMARSLQQNIHVEIENKRTQPRSARLLEVPEAGEAVDFDELYDQTEKSIRQAVRHVMESPPPALAFKPEAFDELQLRLTEQQETYQQIQNLIERLNEEFETQELETLCKPLQIYLNRFEHMIGHSHKILNLVERIGQELDLVIQVTEEARNTQDPEDVPILEENLDAIRDNADRYGSELEHLQNQKLSVKPLTVLHAELLAAIELFEDATEEAESRLKQHALL